jgi:hypothetical protein
MWCVGDYTPGYSFGHKLPAKSRRRDAWSASENRPPPLLNWKVSNNDEGPRDHADLRTIADADKEAAST